MDRYNVQLNTKEELFFQARMLVRTIWRGTLLRSDQNTWTYWKNTLVLCTPKEKRTQTTQTCR